MTWEKLTRQVLFLAGMLTGGGAAYLFYNNYIAPGAAYLVMTALFLWFATRARPVESSPQARVIVDDEALAEMALLLADVAVSGLKGVGRTVPPSTKEVERLEDRLNALLNHVGVPSSSRAGLAEEFEKLRGRVRRNEGGIALIRGARL